MLHNKLSQEKQKELLELVKNSIISEMFQAHITEYNLLLNDPDNQALFSISLQENLKIYSKEELEKQLVLLSLPYYNKQLQQLNYDKEIDFKKKAKLIRSLKEKLKNLKSGKLVDF